MQSKFLAKNSGKNQAYICAPSKNDPGKLVCSVRDVEKAYYATSHHNNVPVCDPNDDHCPSSKVEDTSFMFVQIAECKLKTELRLQKGSYYPPPVYQFDKAIYPPFLEFAQEPPDLTSFEGGPQGYLTPLAKFFQDKFLEYYNFKGTLEIYKDPVGESKFTMHTGGSTMAETAIHDAFAFEGTGLPQGKKNYIILQSVPNYDGPSNFGASSDTPNVWNFLYTRGNAASTIAQLNQAVANLKAGLTPQGTNPSDMNPPRSQPIPTGDWNIIEWIITPGNPLGNLPNIDHDLDNPVGAVDWLPRTTFVVDAAFSTPAYQIESGPDVVQHAVNLVREIRSNPNYELITFGSISKQHGLVSIRLHYQWFPERLWRNRPNWMQWYDRSIVTGAGIGYHSIEFVMNTMQEELDGNAEEIDAEFNSVNIHIQKSLLYEFQMRYPGQVTRLSEFGGPVLYLEFAPSVWNGYPNMSAFLADNFGYVVNSGNQYNNPALLPMPNAAGQCRFATCNGTGDYVAVLNRTAGYNKYKASDFLPKSKKSKKIIASHPGENMNYIATLDDEHIEADASDGNITITLPSLQSFACVPRGIIVHNISCKNKCVRVITANVVPVNPLDIDVKSGDSYEFHWISLANMEEGQWTVCRPRRRHH